MGAVWSAAAGSGVQRNAGLQGSACWWFLAGLSGALQVVHNWLSGCCVTLVSILFNAIYR